MNHNPATKATECTTMKLLRRAAKIVLGWLLLFLILGIPEGGVASPRMKRSNSADRPPRLVIETGGHLAVIRTLLFTAEGNLAGYGFVNA
jgi:hypothetical protein